MSNLLTASVLLPEDSAWHQVELRLTVDGADLIASVFDRGPCRDPDALLGSDSPLLPGPAPREVLLAEAGCTWGCCGAIFVRISRDGDDVVWDRWRNPDDPELTLPEIRFDLAQYTAELARADGARRWEWCGRTVARLVRDGPDVLDRWHSALDWVQSLPATRDRVDLVFTSPPRRVLAARARTAGEPVEHRQYRLRFPVTDEPAARQAERIIATLRERDPRAGAEICGGC